MKTLTAVLIAGVLLLGACSAEPGSKTRAEPAPTPTEIPSPTPTEIPCTDEGVSDTLALAQDLDSRLGIGIVFDAYSERVGDVRSSWDAMGDLSSLEECLPVLKPLAKALDYYAEAHDIWNRCTGDLYCDLEEDALPKIRDKWRKASSLLASAERNLSR